MRKTFTGIIPKLLMVAIIGLGVRALGDGTRGTQGPRFLGAGLEELRQYPDGSQSPMGMPYYVQSYTFTGTTFPPAIPTAITVVPPTPGAKKSFELLSGTCVLGANSLLADCSVMVKSLVPGQKYVCDEGNPDKTPVHLIAIKGAWDPAGGITFSAAAAPSNSVVYACLPQVLVPPPPDPNPKDLDKIGAFGKCVGWGFEPTPSSQDEFLACVRAVRADYCGLGSSYTEPGTPFALYDASGSNPPSAVCSAKECFEASWHPNGATCINHRRYEGLLRLANLREQKPVQTNDRGAQTGKSFPIPLNGMTCETRGDPLAVCLSKYKDYYYDDAHPITLTVFEPVDVVSAQFVCKVGVTRRIGNWIFTRTSVRLPNPLTHKMDVLACCDTLDCP